MELAAVAALAALVSAVVCASLIGAGPIDAPNVKRKSHRAPTPTSGGIGIASGFAAALIGLGLAADVWREALNTQGARLLTSVAFASYAFLAIGFYDDARPLGPRLKTFLFVAVALFAAYAIGPTHKLPFGFATLRFSYAGAMIGSALWIFAMVNFTNFMDGANGLAMGMMAIGLSALGAIAILLGSPIAAGLGFSAAGALLGFLIWNFPKGRLFAGDSGALFVGALAALCSLLVIRRTGLSPFVPAILFLPTIADAALTLIYRVSKRRSMLEGHSEHVYQIATRAGWPHWRVSLIYWLITAVCCAIGVAVAFDVSQVWPPIALVALTLTLVVVATKVRRDAAQRGIAEI
jgi:UDP-N-acetylmuramyl pentapeptide phosphotransferase/UDP-N-acetylglucosamine-1-phosphate transferase